MSWGEIGNALNSTVKDPSKFLPLDVLITEKLDIISEKEAFYSVTPSTAVIKSYSSITFGSSNATCFKVYAPKLCGGLNMVVTAKDDGTAGYYNGTMSIYCDGNTVISNWIPSSTSKYETKTFSLRVKAGSEIYIYGNYVTISSIKFCGTTTKMTSAAMITNNIV